METTQQTSDTNQSSQFKTNIKCGACITTVTPFLNEAVGVGQWQVDLQSPNKTLTVESEKAALVKPALEKAGYKAEPLA